VWGINGLVCGVKYFFTQVSTFTTQNILQMKKLLYILFLISGTGLYAQQAPIAIVSTSGTTTLTSTLDSAAFLAQDNDIIYLPGGNIAGQTVTHFYKKVTVIGVGHNPDSTSATDRTFINGSIGFSTGAEGSVLDGVYVSGDVYFTSQCKIYRTNANTIQVPCYWNLATNALISQCVVRIHLSNESSCGQIVNSKISNCIIGSVPGSNFTTGHSGNIFENCVFLVPGVYGIEGASLCTFRNCTFTKITGWGGVGNNTFQNNVFATATVPPTDSSQTIPTGNYLNQNDAATFVTVPGAGYDYSNDYQIKSTSQGHNGGTDGKDVGIYGGNTPWKKGNVPPNPHIRTKNVDATTGPGGTLRVRFNVGVQ